MNTSSGHRPSDVRISPTVNATSLVASPPGGTVILDGFTEHRTGFPSGAPLHRIVVSKEKVAVDRTVQVVEALEFGDIVMVVFAQDKVNGGFSLSPGVGDGVRGVDAVVSGVVVTVVVVTTVGFDLALTLARRAVVDVAAGALVDVSAAGSGVVVASERCSAVGAASSSEASSPVIAKALIVPLSARTAADIPRA